MILDRLTNASRDFGGDERIAAALRYLQQTDLTFRMRHRSRPATAFAAAFLLLAVAAFPQVPPVVTGPPHGALVIVGGGKVGADQHMLARNRQDDLEQVVSAHPDVLGISIDESTAIAGPVSAPLNRGG